MSKDKAELRREIKLRDVPEILRKRKKSGELSLDEIGERFEAVREYFGHPDDFTKPYPTLARLLSLVFPGFNASTVHVGRKRHSTSDLRKLHRYFTARQNESPHLNQKQLIRKHRAEIHDLFPFTADCTKDESLMNLVRDGKKAAETLELSELLAGVLRGGASRASLAELYDRPHMLLADPTTRSQTKKLPPK